MIAEPTYTPRDVARIVLLACATLLTLCLLALLWELHPEPPPLPRSWTEPISSLQGEEAIFDVLWGALMLALLALAHALAQEITLTIIERREAQIAALAARVLPKPKPPRSLPPASSYPAYADKYVLTLAPRPTPEPPAPAPAVAASPGIDQQPAATAARATATVEQHARVSISLLGPLRIEGTRRPLKRASTRELIAYLALHPHGGSRDELVEAIWPGQDPRRTRPRFWQSVTDARKTLGEAWIARGEHYQLDRSKLDIDLDQLEGLLEDVDGAPDELGTLEDALSLWRGQPLAGSDYPWAEGQLRRLHATLLDLLGRAAQVRLESGYPREALQAAEQAIALDPLHEPAWQLALQAEHALGLRSSITHRYQSLRDTLDEQAGLQPSRETRILYHQLLEQT